MARDALYEDKQPFVKTAFNVRIGSAFSNYGQAIGWANRDERFGSGYEGEGDIPPELATILSAKDGPDSPKPHYYSKRKNRDTRIGGNDAINSYYQYCSNDDVRHEFLKTENLRGSMGRVYSENIDDYQQLVYLTFGLPEYNNAIGFYSRAIHQSVADFMNKGSEYRLARSLGNLVGTFIVLPIVSLRYVWRFVNSLGRTFEITKYYTFRPEMVMYYKFVNSIMIRIAVNMGLAGDNFLLQGSTTTDEGQGIPQALQDSGFDIYRILLRKYRYEESVNILNDTSLSTDGMLNRYPHIQGENKELIETEEITDVEGQTVTLSNVKKNLADRMIDDFFVGTEAALYDVNLFVGFRVEKSTDSSESLSNSTKASDIGSKVNSIYEKGKSISHSAFGGNIGNNPIANALEGIGVFIGSALKSTAEGVGIGGAASLLSGAARIDFPEIWDDSTFTKSYPFNMSLRSPYGDPLSIFQSIYIPMAIILAGSLPRATGLSSYTSPFLTRAYCRGMFSCPLGIIDSVSIKRGSDQHGWSVSRQPLAVDINFTIKDLSPMMYMTMTPGLSQQDNIFENILAVMSTSDTSFTEYMETLGGMTTRDRIRILYKIRRNAQIYLGLLFNNKLNPTLWGASFIRSTAPGRIFSALTPNTRIPDN